MTKRLKPRISINKLGEYLVATPLRRRTIIRDQKYPAGFKVTRYRDAIDPIVAFLQGGAADDGIIYSAIDDLAGRVVTTDFQQQDRDLSIEALTTFLDLADQIDLEDLEVTSGDPNTPPLSIAGVSVSVRPDIVLNRDDRNGGSRIGIMKVYVVKNYPLTEEAGAYIGALLNSYCEELLATNAVPDYRLCSVVDVFSRCIHAAPRSFRRRLDQVTAACQEIATFWPSVTKS